MNLDLQAHPLDTVRILLVEDDADLLETLATHLEALGANVMRACTAAGARSAMADASFDLLVSDLGLPDGSGYDLAVEARSSQRVKVALALSGHRDDDSLDASRASGFQMHLTKPFDSRTLGLLVGLLTGRAS